MNMKKMKIIKMKKISYLVKNKINFEVNKIIEFFNYICNMGLIIKNKLLYKFFI
jgi:hypothetical protein